MKQTIKSILAIMMVLCMLFTVVGCGGNEDVNSDERVAADDSFFTDEATQNEKEDNTSNDGNSDGKGNNNGGKTDGTTVVPEENKVGGKSWKEVLASMPKKLRGKTITLYNWNSASDYTGAADVIKDFTKQTGVKVKWQNVTNSNYYTKLQALVASGKDIPDVVRVSQGDYSKLRGLLQPLSVSGYDFTDEAWDKTIMGIYTFNNKAFATSLQNTHMGSPSLMLYDMSKIKKYDLEDPYDLWKAGKWTWNKYIEMCREIKEIVPDAGFKPSSGEGFFKSYAACFGLGGSIAYDGTKFTNIANTPKFLEVHQMIGDFYNREKLFDFGGMEKMNNGQCVFSIATAIHLRRKHYYYGNVKAANNLYAVPMPAIDGQSTYYQGMYESEAYAIPKGAPTPEAVPYLLRYLLDGANYELANYFCNEQNLEVYNWCMSQPNKIAPFGYPLSLSNLDEKGIMLQTGAQMKSFIDSNAGAFQLAVEEYNDILTTFK